MKWALRGLALSFLAAAALAADQPKLDWETRDYDQVQLDLDVDVDMDAQTIRGTATHRIASMREGLDVVRMHLEDMKAESVTCDGAACRFEHDGKILSITLDRPRKKDEAFTLVIRYGGKPTSGLWFSKP